MWRRARTEWNLYWLLTNSHFDAVGDLRERLALLTLGLHMQTGFGEAEGAAGQPASPCQQDELTDHVQAPHARKNYYKNFTRKGILENVLPTKLS